MNPRFNNPSLTDSEEKIVIRIHDAIVAQHGHSGGYCGLGAIMAVTICGTDDYEVMNGPGHWWARNKHTGAILDPTVDQFDHSRLDYHDPLSPALPGEEYAHEKLYPKGDSDDLDRVLDSYMKDWHDWAKDYCDNFTLYQSRKDAA